MPIVILESQQIAQVGREHELVAFGSVYSDGVNSCLSNGLCKGGNSLVEFDCGLNGRVCVEGGVQGRSVEGPVGVFVMIKYPGCAEIRMEANFEHYGVMVRGESRDRWRFGGGTTLWKLADILA